MKSNGCITCRINAANYPAAFSIQASPDFKKAGTEVVYQVSFGARYLRLRLKL